MHLLLVILLFWIVVKFHVLHGLIHVFAGAIHGVLIIIIAIFILVSAAVLYPAEGPHLDFAAEF